MNFDSYALPRNYLRLEAEGIAVAIAAVFMPERANEIYEFAVERLDRMERGRAAYMEAEP